jgi:hypothetical protein
MTPVFQIRPTIVFPSPEIAVTSTSGRVQDPNEIAATSAGSIDLNCALRTVGAALSIAHKTATHRTIPCELHLRMLALFAQFVDFGTRIIEKVDMRENVSRLPACGDNPLAINGAARPRRVDQTSAPLVLEAEQLARCHSAWNDAISAESRA